MNSRGIKDSGNADFNDLYAATPGGNYTNMFLMKRQQDNNVGKFVARGSNDVSRSVSRGGHTPKSTNKSRDSNSKMNFGRGSNKQPSGVFIFN